MDDFITNGRAIGGIMMMIATMTMGMLGGAGVRLLEKIMQLAAERVERRKNDGVCKVWQEVIP
jgi:hypothetical protein